ncbi:MAG: protein translocase subunit SecF [Deltaproteobacteria bacterium]|nr:MAG: protein translocase subunit SecF [Deltaproteobacteria bacterium]
MAKFFRVLPADINYDFVGFRNRFLTMSGLAVLAALVLIGVRSLNFGIDFSGGTEVQVAFVACGDDQAGKKTTQGKKVTVCVKKADLKPNTLRKKIHALFPEEKPSVQPTGTNGNEFMLKFQSVSFLNKKDVEDMKADVTAAFASKKGNNFVSLRFRQDSGNKVDIVFKRALVVPKKKKDAKGKKGKKPAKKAKKATPKSTQLKVAKKATSKPASKKVATSKPAGKGSAPTRDARIAALKKLPELKRLQAVFEGLKLKNIKIESSGRQGSNFEYTVTFDGLSAKLSEKLNKAFGVGAYKIQQVETVGPRVGKKLRNDGILSLLMANLFILIYIAIRFDFRYAPGAVAALLHDVTITTGIFSVLQLPFDLSTIAALLTIVGYSLNDTIVVYDRIRENWQKSRVDFGEVMNRSINETLSRTLLTSVTTFLAVLPIYIIGGANIKWFAFAMMFGILIGTYSSIAIASPLVYWLDQYFSSRMRQEDEEVEAKRERRRRRRAGLKENTEEA